MRASYEPIVSLRDLFMRKGNPEAVEICNELMSILDESPSLFILSKEEAKELAKYFLECGYLSHEFHEPIHKIVDRLVEFVRRVE